MRISTEERGMMRGVGTLGSGYGSNFSLLLREHSGASPAKSAAAFILVYFVFICV